MYSEATLELETEVDGVLGDADDEVDDVEEAKELEELARVLEKEEIEEVEELARVLDEEEEEEEVDETELEDERELADVLVDTLELILDGATLGLDVDEALEIPRDELEAELNIAREGEGEAEIEVEVEVAFDEVGNKLPERDDELVDIDEMTADDDTVEGKLAAALSAMTKTFILQLAPHA